MNLPGRKSLRIFPTRLRLRVALLSYNIRRVFNCRKWSVFVCCVKSARANPRFLFSSSDEPKHNRNRSFEPVSLQILTPALEGILINVLRIIDEIEQLVENGKGGWLGKRLINEEEFFTKIQQLRSALPKSMKEAEDLMRKAEAVVNSAQTEAERLVTTAEAEAEKIVSDARTRSERAIAESKNHADRLLSDAQSRSERMVGDAQTKADRTIDDANNQAQKTIDDANSRAEHIEKDARERADEMVAEHSVTIRANEEGEQLVLNASREAEDLRRHADDYAFEVLDKVTNVLDKLTVSVDAGKQALRANSSMGDDQFAAYNGSSNGDFNGARRS
jgi:cell division septum initiation protein DivIVA